MRFYNKPHVYYAGIDLHARTLSLCVLDANGRICLQKTIPASPTDLLDALAPYRDDLVLACERMFAWYWLADSGKEKCSTSSDSSPVENNRVGRLRPPAEADRPRGNRSGALSQTPNGGSMGRALIGLP